MQKLRKYYPTRHSCFKAGIMMSVFVATLMAHGQTQPAHNVLQSAESFGPEYVEILSATSHGESAPEEAKEVAAETAAITLPPVLSNADVAAYKMLQDLQSEGKWEEANELIGSIENPVLMGKIFASRYQSNDYTATYNELNTWLATYGDHPEADAIKQLALSKRKGTDAALASVPAKSKLTGYGDDNGLGAPERRLDAVDEAAWVGREDARRWFGLIESNISATELADAEAKLISPESTRLLKPFEYDVVRWHLAAHYLYHGNPYKAYTHASNAADRSGSLIPNVNWIAGISAWQVENYAAAAKHFTAMSDASKQLSAWETSAAAFWAYRSLLKTGKSAEATRYLSLAAEKPRTFYGILARKVRGESINGNAENVPELDDEAITALYEIPAVKRTIALTQMGDVSRAEQELRALFPDVDQETRISLLSMAQQLKLPAVQISMAKMLKSKGLVYTSALYPTPGWQPLTGFAVDPALVFAFARQESGFHEKAKSNMGAMGLMQLMPDTARSMQARVGQAGIDVSRVYEPEANLTLGQTYLDYLLDNPLVDGNLIYLAASYNAGPGNVANWQKTVTHNGDPLLFMESIPFSATRNYVAQVLTSYWMYQAIEGSAQTSALALARGQWPRYEDSKTRVVESVSPDRG